MDGYIGEIRLFAAAFAPRNWAYCNGQIIAIQSNTTLFSIIGTTYGGNGSTNFQLPNFAGRVAVGIGQLTGGSLYPRGQMGGAGSHTLKLTEMPSHTHVGTVSGTADLLVSAADSTLPAATAGSAIATPGYLVAGGLAKTLGFNNATPNTVLHADSIKLNNGPIILANAGADLPHTNMQPSIGMNYIICLYGIFPSRN